MVDVTIREKSGSFFVDVFDEPMLITIAEFIYLDIKGGVEYQTRDLARHRAEQCRDQEADRIQRTRR